MIKLSAEPRKKTGKQLNTLRKKGKLPAVVYGAETKKPLSIAVDYKDFKEIYKEVGGTSLISLKIKGKGKEYPVLIHDYQKHPLTDNFLHVDFYQASLEEEVEATVPIVFTGTSIAVEGKEGTLVKNMSEIQVKALPQKLPSKIEVDISSLEDFEDHITVEDLDLPEGAKFLREPDEIIASVTPPEEVEEELEKPIEEKVEEVETVEEATEEEAPEEGVEPKADEEKPGEEKKEEEKPAGKDKQESSQGKKE